ncbi:histidinol phosphatase [Pedobacter sp. HMF7647]|uniref:protein-tyrosine-phosphatase n=1 Tax=Hufsiella arboris TaxID=2695275 RepID=A0A7K1YCM5_9SPHI|nr:CpsB/CapC family capsule biosynthesis tyrosine phosphatase [Hufsiella arboris]MXV52131.1 histidinol phosphatase [Hufsiella arboris]
MLNIFRKKISEISFENIGIDIHSHLLPGLDDGSKTIIQSVDFIKRLQKFGFEKFVCTPHIFMEVYPNNKETISAALASLNSLPEIKSMPVTVEAAAEYMMDENFDDLLLNDQVLCLPDNHVLIEMSYQVESRNISQYVFNLLAKGYKPILAHPERYTYYHDNMQPLIALKDAGCLFQLNLLSVTGYYGKRVKAAAVKLLSEKLIDFAGTDLHHERHLRMFEDITKWQDCYHYLRNYPFRNRELFGMSLTSVKAS